MILFREQHEEANVIHIIMGNESDFQMAMSGSIVIDLTESLDSEKRNILYINKCESEEELQRQISYYEKKHKKIKREYGGPKNNIEEESPQTIIPVGGEKQEPLETEHGIFTKKMKCPKCLCWGTFVKNGIPTMCNICRQIEEGLESGDIPDPPSLKQREKIVEDFFKKKRESKNG